MKKLIGLLTLTIVAIFYLTAQTKSPQPVNSKASIVRGQIVYRKVCLSCHMADGGGVPRMNPPLIQTSYILGDKSKIIYIVLHGLADRVPINDEYYSNNMPPQANLNNQQIADVLTYVRNSFGNKASAVTVAEVKAVRDKKN